MKYDSTEDTKVHIQNVKMLLWAIIKKVEIRARMHDRTKLQSPEKEMFDEFTPKLRAMTYDSEEYKACLQEMGRALEHHYKFNSHHPEHWENGVDDMSLLDVIEMLADWVAATRRHADGSVRESLMINRKRFKITDQLYKVICNTAVELEWIPSLPADKFLGEE